MKKWLRSLHEKKIQIGRLVLTLQYYPSVELGVQLGYDSILDMLFFDISIISVIASVEVWLS
jgi:hypothetical protein